MTFPQKSNVLNTLPPPYSFIHSVPLPVHFFNLYCIHTRLCDTKFPIQYSTFHLSLPISTSLSYCTGRSCHLSSCWTAFCFNDYNSWHGSQWIHVLSSNLLTKSLQNLMSVYTATKQESKPYSKTNSLSKKKQLQIFAKISFPKTFPSFMTSDVQVWSKKFHLHVNKIHNLCWLVYSVWVRTVALYFLNIEVMSILKYKANANQWMQWSECCFFLFF